MVKISVIIPVYNAKTFLRDCLDSVLSQSLREIEIICADEGSTDGSADVLAKYQDRDRRVHVIRQAGPNDGAAVNAAIEAAEGDYIHVLDPASSLLPFVYEVLYNKVVKYELDVLRFASLDAQRHEKTYVDIPKNSLSGLKPEDFQCLVRMEKKSPLRKVGMPPELCVYRRAFLLEKTIRFAELTVGGEYLFTAGAAVHAARIMISRDRVVLHKNGERKIPEDRLPERNYTDYFLAAELVSQRMEQDPADPDVCEAALNLVYGTLIDQLTCLLKGTTEDTALKEATEAFVRSFAGPYSFFLKRAYLQSPLSVSGPSAAEKKRYKKIRPYREACAAPKVSVVVPVYGVEDYINEALNSLMTQTLEDMEFVLVNDGTKDGSFAIMQEYAALDKRFRILDGPNGGYGKAMNRGMDAASGTYLGILEPDDFVPAEMFEKLYLAAEQNRADFVKADFYKFSMGPDGKIEKKRQALAPDTRYYNRVFCPLEEPDVFKFVINNWSGIYRMSFLNQWGIRHNETPGASYQDNGLWFKIFCRAKRGYFLNEIFYYYRQDNPNASMNSTGKMYAITEEYRLIYEWLEQDPALLEQVRTIFYMKKLNSFFITLYRLNVQLQPEYVRHFHDEFKDLYEAGALDQSYLVGNTNWNRFTELMENPDGYLDRIRVSVIMPVYNAARWLEETLDSLLGLNEIPFEVICVDDGSTDDSLQILRRYEQQDRRVRVITQKNAGAGAARNTGMAYARGEYLSFLDADDIFSPNMMRFVYDKAYESNADIVVFRSDKYIEASGRYERARYTIRRDLLPKEEPFAGRDIVYNIFKAFVSYPWDKFFRADFVRENGLKFQEQYATNDLLFVFSALLKAERIVTMDAVLVHYRKGESTVTAGRNNGNWGCFYQALTALREQMRRWDLYETREQDFINYSLHSSLWNLSTLRGEAYHALYDKLKSEWLDDLGITTHDVTYFYNRDDWEELQKILALSAEDYLVRRIADLKEGASEREERFNERLEDARKQKQAINRKLRITYREKAERGEEIRRLKGTFYYKVRHKAAVLLRRIGLLH